MIVIFRFESTRQKWKVHRKIGKIIVKRCKGNLLVWSYTLIQMCFSIDKIYGVYVRYYVECCLIAVKTQKFNIGSITYYTKSIGLFPRVFSISHFLCFFFTFSNKVVDFTPKFICSILLRIAWTLYAVNDIESL